MSVGRRSRSFPVILAAYVAPTYDLTNWNMFTSKVRDNTTLAYNTVKFNFYQCLRYMSRKTFFAANRVSDPQIATQPSTYVRMDN